MIASAFRLIFVHQRKCAGCSIISAFGLTPDEPDWAFMNDGALSPEYPARPRDHLVVSIVRDPWDRFVSGWKYCRSTRGRSLREVLLKPPAEGHDFRHLTRPQHAILFDQDRPIFDRLMRFETVQADFDRLCDEIGKPRCELPRLNVGRRGPAASYFDEETRRLFVDRYGRDLELFGYSATPSKTVRR